MIDKPLNYRQSLFVDYFTGDEDCKGNAYKSALKAGYTERTSQRAPEQLSRNIKVIAAIKVKMAELKEKIGHNYEIAVEMLRKRLGWLNVMAEKGNVQAIQAQTAIIRELNDITGLHKQIIVDTREQKMLDEAQKAEARRIASIRLCQGVA